MNEIFSKADLKTNWNSSGRLRKLAMPEVLEEWLFPRPAGKSWEVSYCWSQSHGLFCILIPIVPVPATQVLSGLDPRCLWHGAWNLLSVHLKMWLSLMIPFSICRAPVCQDYHVPPGLICHALWPARPHTTSELQPSGRRCEASLTLLPPHPSIPSAFQWTSFGVGSAGFLPFSPQLPNWSQSLTWVNNIYLIMPNII